MRRPLDELASEVTQSQWSIEHPTHGESITAAQANIDITYRIDTSAKEQLQAPLPNGLYVMSVECSGGPYDITSFFARRPIPRE